MVGLYHTDIEMMGMPAREEWEEREAARRVSVPPSTFPGFPSLTATQNIRSSYRPFFDIMRQMPGAELGPEQLSDIENASNNLNSMLKLTIGDIHQNKTLSPYPTSDLRILEHLYDFRNQSEVIRFAVDNSFLLQTLHEASEQIRNYFGESVQAVLEVVSDPEFFEDQELVIFIRTDLSPDEAFEKLEQMDDEWWLDVPADVRKNLCIDVEFI